jgi:hypothetical protein
MLGWLLPIPTALGLYGMQRAAAWAGRPRWSWLLIPLLGFTIAGCALTRHRLRLMPPERWNARFNPQARPTRRRAHQLAAPLARWWCRC